MEYINILQLGKYVIAVSESELFHMASRFVYKKFPSFQNSIDPLASTINPQLTAVEKQLSGLLPSAFQHI